MKYLKYFEGKLNEREYLMGKLLHLYGSIPVPKEKSSVVISKIIITTRGEYYKLGQNVDIVHCKTHDRVRFCDYFESLMENKDIRGHNFEGLVCGLFGGELAPRGAKYDLTIDDKKYSVKFVDGASKAPELGRYKKSVENEDVYSDIMDVGGLTELFKSDNNLHVKKRIWDYITPDVDGWILAYPGPKDSIVINKIDKDNMFRILAKGLVASPKGGKADKFSLALSAKYKRYTNLISTSVINIPTITLDELREENKDDDDNAWSNRVFGRIGSKIRPDVLRYIKLNKDFIADKLKEDI